MELTADQLSTMMKGMGAAGVGSGLWSLFGGGSNPYKGTEKYFNQIPGAMDQYFSPYRKAGLDSLGQLQGQYGNLMNDPGSLLAKIGAGYKESPGFQFEKNQGLNSIENAAAAGGMLGTSGHQQQAGDLASNLASRDYNSYLNNALGLYNRGLSGTEGLNQMGFDANSAMAQAIASMLMNKGMLNFAGNAAENQARSKGISDLISGGAALAFL